MFGLNNRSEMQATENYDRIGYKYRGDASNLRSKRSV
jgi:hypothetical protein